MKKFFTILIMAVACLVGSSDAAAGFRFGVRAGINVNELHLNKKTFDADNGCGFTGGVMTEFEIPVIGLCFDASLMYTRMNSEVGRDVKLPSSGTTILESPDHNVGKNFIELPINVKYKVNIPAVASIIKPYVFTGPSFAFKLDGNTYEKMKTRTCQVAWNVGLGVELIKHLQVGASYGFGINNIADHWVNATDIKVKNNYWTVTAAWLF